MDATMLTVTGNIQAGDICYVITYDDVNDDTLYTPTRPLNESMYSPITPSDWGGESIMLTVTREYLGRGYLLWNHV